MRTHFEIVNDRIIMNVFQMVWDEQVLVHKEDVTDKVLPVVDDLMDERLGLK